VLSQMTKAGVNPAFVMEGPRCMPFRAVHVPLRVRGA
jgi:hypothetical protein